MAGDTSAFFDGEGKNMNPNSSWRSEQRVAFEVKGIGMACAAKLETYFKDQGSEDVAVKKFRRMHGPWEGIRGP